MTYGTLPDYDTCFRVQFDHILGRLEYYNIVAKGSMKKFVESGDYSPPELFKVVKQLVKQWQQGEDEAGDIASSILETLGIEWV